MDSWPLSIKKIMDSINSTKDLSEDDAKALAKAIEDFKASSSY